MKLINLLIRELNNCSLWGDFLHHAEICQFDGFSLEINFKRARSCDYGIPDWVQVKKNTLYLFTKFIMSLPFVTTRSLKRNDRLTNGLFDSRCLDFNAKEKIIILKPALSE